MGDRRYSRLAIISCLLNLPWMALLGWCFWVVGRADSPVAGEIFLLPLMAWFGIGIPAGLCGLVALVNIRFSPSQLRGQRLAILGMLLATVVPVLGIAENMWSTIRAKRINRESHGQVELSDGPSDLIKE